MKRIILRYLLLLPLLAMTFHAEALDLPVKVVKGTEVYYYKVNNNESVYGISKKLGIPREDIVRHNPSVADGVKRGMMLYFPVAEYADEETVAETAPEIASEQPAQQIATDSVIEKKPSIALLLPFGLNSAEPSRENKLALDFYKGFLIGADTLSRRPGEIDIYAIDTDDKSESIAGILSKRIPPLPAETMFSMYSSSMTRSILLIPVCFRPVYRRKTCTVWQPTPLYRNMQDIHL